MRFGADEVGEQNRQTKREMGALGMASSQDRYLQGISSTNPAGVWSRAGFSMQRKWRCFFNLWAGSNPFPLWPVLEEKLNRFSHVACAAYIESYQTEMETDPMELRIVELFYSRSRSFDQ